MRFAVRATFALAIALAVGTAGALAHVPDGATSAFEAGKFTQAAILAEKDGDADALAFAAMARIADAVSREDGFCASCLLQAEAIAKAAIKRDPNLADGYVQLAVAVGFRARQMNLLDAQAEGFAEMARAALDRALELDPSNNWARASLGGWHLEIVYRAGPAFASILFGANEDDGLAHFRKALAAEPDSLLLHYHFALSILAVDPDAFRAEAAAMLTRGLSDPRADAMTRLMRPRARELQKLLAAGGDEEIERLVRRFQGYPSGVEPTVARH